MQPFRVFRVFRGELNFMTKAYRAVRHVSSNLIIEVAANVAISLREMSLVRCMFQSQLPFSNSVDETVLRIRREFPVQWACCKDTSRRSETATLQIAGANRDR